MGKINSRAKGCRGEREVRDLFKAAGFEEARRGQQFAGGTDSPDVIVPGLAGYHVEVKLVENLNLYKAREQAIKDGSGKEPLVFHRKSHTPWLVTLDAKKFLELIKHEAEKFNIPVGVDSSGVCSENVASIDEWNRALKGFGAGGTGGTDSVAGNAIHQ